MMVGAETGRFNSKNKHIIPKNDRGLLPLDDDKRR
jgi:hypothetical protein